MSLCALHCIKSLFNYKHPGADPGISMPGGHTVGKRLAGGGGTPLFFSKFWATLGLILTHFFLAGGGGGGTCPLFTPLDPPLASTIELSSNKNSDKILTKIV